MHQNEINAIKHELSSVKNRKTVYLCLPGQTVFFKSSKKQALEFLNNIGSADAKK
ncbi:hypothetical protein HZS_301 [Henneguya salminicola]|nr:hypothetical protein HZS_301 [Henneguya salminicola]